MRMITTLTAIKDHGLVPSYEHWVSYGYWTLVMIGFWRSHYYD